MIAVTMGDPAGIGPEIVLKGWRSASWSGGRWLWIGDPEVLEQTCSLLGWSDRPFRVVNRPTEIPPAGYLAVLPVGVPVKEVRCGHPDPGHATAVVESIRLACQLALAGEVAAVVTPPIGKAVLHAGGYPTPGHTEMLAGFTGADHPVMMLAGRGLRVVPATIHTPLRAIFDLITPELLHRVVMTTWEGLRRDFGIAAPRLALAGLNPHAGEGGSFGREEVDWIAPWCRQLVQTTGIPLEGPRPADSLFATAVRRRYDAIVCMYHDQALIPLKMHAFGRAVNITLGLPIVRTSVDHGTAYDLAGRGLADPGSFVAAVRLAFAIAGRRKRYVSAGGAP